MIDLYLPSLISLFLTKKGEKNLFDLYSLWPLCWWLTKRGRRIWDLYACLRNIYVYAYMFCLANRRKRIYEFYVWLACLSPCFCIHVHEPSLHIYYVSSYAWVKGELLWSLTLIHAYIIILWLLAQRPSTLVLMMTKLMELYMHD